MKNYDTQENITRPEALRMILSGTPENMSQGFISLTYHDKDPQWLIEKLMQHANHSDVRVRATVLHCLFLASRVRGILNPVEAYAVAIHNLDATDNDVYIAADELLDEVVNVTADSFSPDIDEIEKSLHVANEFEVLVALTHLFRFEEPRDQIKSIIVEILSNATPMVKARCLYDVRSFLLQENDELDLEFTDKVLKLVQSETAPYVTRKANELKDWIKEVSPNAK